MTCLIKNNKGVIDSLVEEIKSLERMDAEEYQDIYGTSLIDDVNTLKGLQEASKAKDSKYVKAEKSSVLANDEADSELELEFKNSSGARDGSFTFQWRGANSNTQGLLKSLKYKKGMYHLKFISKGKTYTYKFNAETTGRSVDTSSGNFITVPSIINTLHTDISKRKVLKSKNKATARELSDAMKQTEYQHGSVESMKAMLNRLNILGGEKASEDEMNYLNSLFDKMSPEMFSEMELYLDENAKDTAGSVRAKRIDMRVNKDAPTFGNQQTEASVYAEEIIHAMTMFAINLAETDKTVNGVKAKQEVRKLDFLMEVTRKKMKWQDLLPEVSINSTKEETEAKELYSYIIDGKTNRYEFVAKVLTVPELRTAVDRIKMTDKESRKSSGSILDRVVSFFEDILNAVLGNYSLKDRNESVLSGTLNLAFALGDINKNAAEGKHDQSMMSVAIDMLNETDYEVSKVFDGLKKHIINEDELVTPPKETDSKYKKAKWLAESLYLILTNGTYTKAAGYIVTQLGLPPESTIREVVSGLFPTEPAQKMAEILGLQAGFIDKKRNTQIQIVRSATLEKFSKNYKVTEKEEEVLTAIIVDLDLSSIMDNKSNDGSKAMYDNKTIRQLLTNPEFLENRITRLKDALRESDKDNYNWHSIQAMGLGMMLATHKGSPAQNVNAENIIRGYLSSHRKSPNKNTIKLVDELATLAAIKYANKQDKAIAADLMKREYRGVKHIADMYEGFKLNSDEVAFSGSKAHKIKGYRKELYDDSIMLEVAPLEKREEMEKAGFTYKNTLTPSRGEIHLKPMALYVTSSFGRDDRLRGATRLNSVRAKGTSVSELQYKADKVDPYAAGNREIKRIQKLAERDARLMEEGRYNLEDKEYGLSPIINESGKVVDYRHMINKKNKKELLKEDTRITEVLARSYGGLLDKSESKKHNQLVLDNILNDMKNNYEMRVLDSDYQVGKDGVTEYVAIRKDAVNPEIKKIWALMPREFRTAAENRDDKTIAVPRSLMNLYFGYSQISITDFPGLKKITPRILQTVIRFAEGLWIDLVKVVKTNILLKTPVVPIGNIISNFFLEVMRGSDPIKVIKLYKESYRDIKKYNEESHKLQELINEIVKINVRLGKDNLSSNVSNDLKRKIIVNKREIKLLERKLQENAVHELMVMGLDQSVEDIESEADTNTWSRLGVDKVFSKVPEVVKDGFDILYLNKSTGWYKFNHEVLEMSDLVARDTRLRLDREKSIKQEKGQLSLPSWWVEQQPEGYKTKQVLRGEELNKFREQSLETVKFDLIEDFINYTLPSSRMEEYLNRIGLLMFTKYVKRIQRIILKQSGQGPIKSLVGALTIGYLGGLPSIYEQSFLAKDWYTDSTGPGNIFPIYGPTDHIMNFATPALLKSSTYGL